MTRLDPYLPALGVVGLIVLSTRMSRRFSDDSRTVHRKRDDP